MAEEVGKLTQKFAPVSGTNNEGREWTKLTFVIVCPSGKTQRKVAFDTFNQELIQFITDTSIETVLKVRYEVSSREFNGKWYTNVTAFGAEVVKDLGNDVIKARNSTVIPIAEDGDTDLPF